MMKTEGPDVIRWNRDAWIAVLWFAFGALGIVACIYSAVVTSPFYAFGILGGLLAIWFGVQRAREASRGRTYSNGR